MDNNDLISENPTVKNLIDWSPDDFFADELVKLTILQGYTRLEPHKNYCVLKIHQGIYAYILSYVSARNNGKDRAKNERLADLVSIFICFSDPRLNIVSFTESDLARILGVEERTVRNYIREWDNNLFSVLSGNNKASYAKLKKGVSGANTILPNQYQLQVARVFGKLKDYPKVSTRVLWKQIRIEYKGLNKREYLIKIYNNNLNNNPTRHPTYNAGKIIIQNTDKQFDKCFVFEHFKNPIYESGFDVENTCYPDNWCRHPDARAYFKKGRWYHGSIHGTRRGRHREGYLEYKGLTHEIDMHNAMFYFMVPLLPDSVSEKDKTAYYDMVKAGTLYDDLIEDRYDKLKEKLADDEYGLLSFGAIDVHGLLPDRDTVKTEFQIYRNMKGKLKNKVRDVAVFMGERFPTIHEWMLGNMEVMQNRLAWIETDFISYVGEKLTAENIRFDWLHDAVYVSEEDSVKAQKIWDSVRDEFEAVFTE